MKFTRLLALSSCLLAAVLYLGCQKDVSDETGAPQGPPGNSPLETVKTIVTGRVLDEKGLPMEGVNVRAGSRTVSTDVNGQFKFNAVTVNKDAAFIKAEKNGFFTGSRTFVATAGANQFVNIQLIKKNAAGTFSGIAGGKISVPHGGGEISFDAGSIVTATGNTPYAGTVTVHAFFINPEMANFCDIMPGALRGITTASQEVGLQSFGMLAVDLVGAGGEMLQLATGKPATVVTPIPTTLLAQAPTTIPIWSFNDSSGLWKDEGNATKQGAQYTFKASHFSFWNCDASFPIIDFKAKILDQLSLPLSYAKVVIKVSGDNTSTFGYGYTDSEGNLSGKIPANKVLQLTIYNKCGTLLDTRFIGPFNGISDLGVLTVKTPTLTFVTFSGTMLNCAKQPVSKGFVTILVDGSYYRTNLNKGAFSITIQRCTNTGTTAQITGYDEAEKQAGPAKTVNFTGPAVEAGQLSACGISLAQFVNFKLDQVQYNLVKGNGIDTVKTDNYGYGNIAQVEGYNFLAGSPHISFWYSARSIGKGGIESFSVSAKGQSYKMEAAYQFNLEITEYGPIGGFVAGNFSGVVYDKNSSSKTITGDFRIIRNR